MAILDTIGLESNKLFNINFNGGDLSSDGGLLLIREFAAKMRDVDLEELALYELLQDSMLFRLIQISENAKQLSDEFKDQHSTIPWTAIYGLRNRIVHDYGSVDLSIVFDTLKNDIPELLGLMEKEL